MQDNKKIRSRNSYYLTQKLFWKIFPIQMLLCCVGAVNSLIDGIVGSRFVGADAIAAIGLFNPVSQVFDGIVGMLSVGGIMLITRYMGKADRKRAGGIFSLTCMLLGSIGLVAGVLLTVFAGPFASLLKGDALLKNYIIGCCILLFARMMANILTDTLQVLGYSRRTMIGVVVMAMTNIVGDLLFVAVFHMGSLGLGLATGLSFVTQLAVLLPPFFKKSCALRFRGKELPFKELPDIIRSGMTCCLGQLAISLKGFVQNYVLLAIGGTMAVAASAVNGTLCWFMAAITIGAGQTTLMLMSLYVGEEDRASMRNVLHVVLRYSMAIGFVAMFVMISLAQPFGNLYYANEPQAFEYTVSSIRIFPLFMLPNIFFYVLLRTYQSQGKKTLTYILSTSENLVIAACIAVLGFAFGINGAWAGLPVGSLIMMLATFAVIFIGNRKVTLHSKDMLLCAPSLGVGEKDRLDRTIYDVQNATGLSEEVCRFCSEHGIGERMTHAAGLSVEEISILLFRYSLKDVKNGQADVRIFMKNGKLTIRIRDNGRPLFNNEVIDINDPEDPAANIGIKLLVKMAEDVTANSIMGLNVITVVLNAA